MTTEKYGGIARRPKLASKRSPQGNGHSSWIHIMNGAIGGTAAQENDVKESVYFSCAVAVPTTV